MDEQNIEERLRLVEISLAKISERNHKVELEKAWETSKTRILAVVGLTYTLMCLIFWIIGVQNYFVNAVIPTVGYFLSTQSLPIVKRKWLEKK